MNKTYGRINWENYPSDETPLNESNLNKIDVATDEIDNRVITLDTTKATKEEVSTLVQDVTFEEKTGIITIVKKNGSKATIDTQMEKIAVNFSYNAGTQQIILTLIDGTKQYIDLSALITQYEFLDSDTVAFSIDSAGKVSAIVKEASIQEKHLQPNYLADIKVEVAKAQASQSAAAKSESNAKASEIAAAASESNAAASATKAQSYATGGTNSRTGEDTDNAKYYSQQSAQSQSAAATSADTASTKAKEAAASAATAKTSADNAAGSANLANEKANSAANSATIAVSNSNAAQQYASNAAASADTAQNYAVADTDSAKYYYEQARRISESFSGALRPMGTVAFANLPALSATTSGNMYNISDQFTTTSDFKEGAGNTIPAGANVYKTEDGKWDVLAGTPVTGVKGSAESAYRRGNVNITAENVGAIPAGGNAGSATTVQDYNDTSKKIKVGWVGNSLSQGQILGVACYSSGDDDTVKAKIKDATKDTFKSWLGTVLAANNAAHLGRNGNAGYPMTFNWAGKTGQPTWLWGGENGEDMYVYNPSNFNVSHAKSADSVSWAGVKGTPSTYPPADGSGYYVKNETLTNVNLNNVVKTGVYHLTGTLTNNPINGNATLYVEFDVGTPYQIFIPDYMYIMYKRNYSNGSWGNWQELNTWRPLGTTADTACAGNDSRLSNARPASDVYAWAKASAKPSYNWNEIGNKPTTFTPASHTHSYLPLSGGTLTGDLTNRGATKLYGLDSIGESKFCYSKYTDPLAGTTCCAKFSNAVAVGGKLYAIGNIATTTGWLNLQANNAIQARNQNDSAWVAVNALSFNQQSSRRYKKNIVDMTEEEAKNILQYRVVDYDYKNEADGTNCQGLIAEEVAEICEYPVYRKPDGTIEGLDYSKFVPQLIKMVQLQQEQIERLEQKIEEIKQKL